MLNFEMLFARDNILCTNAGLKPCAVLKTNIIFTLLHLKPSWAVPLVRTLLRYLETHKKEKIIILSLYFFP
jgi:hypothetical protein